MKTQIHRPALAILASALLCLLAPIPARADTVLLGPERPLRYAFTGWKPLDTAQTIRLETLSFEAPANGGGGIVLRSPLDLSADKCLVARIRLRSGNTSENVRIVLLSTDDNGGSEWILPIPAGSKPGDKLVFAGHLDKGHMAHKVAKLADLKAINQIQFIGSFNPDQHVAVDVEVITTSTTVPEDALAAR
ncbi:hypothetical protein OpiT1DRAFT_02552 [Opitutaceae bacterium TAV1]|nr:hypothetical protein OpiT1DRAFT_02552 [Opitutaceae bacterium TAV1]